MSEKIPHPGEARKILLPGETPWAVYIAVHGNCTWTGRINNRLTTELTQEELDEVAQRHGGARGTLKPAPHKFREGDEVTFERSESGWWIPVSS